jgi:hypothetical protein
MVFGQFINHFDAKTVVAEKNIPHPRNKNVWSHAASALRHI